MYLKFKEDVTVSGKVHKKDSVAYVTKKPAKLVEDGKAEEVDYEDYHKTIQKRVIDAKPAKPE